jgi:hypothetical protein
MGPLGSSIVEGRWNSSPPANQGKTKRNSLYFRGERSDYTSKMSNRLKLSQRQFAERARLAWGRRGLAVVKNGTPMPQAAVSVEALKGKRIPEEKAQASNYGSSEGWLGSEKMSEVDGKNGYVVDYSSKNRIEELADIILGTSR